MSITIFNSILDTMVGDVHYKNAPSMNETKEGEVGRYALVVDDDPGIVVLFTMLLKRAGYQVDSATNGKGAMDKIATRKPDVVFLDLMMPVMNGFEVCEQVKTNPQTSDIVIAVISALDSANDINYAKSLGANFYFPKPFYPKQIVNDILPQVESAFK